MTYIGIDPGNAGGIGIIKDSFANAYVYDDYQLAELIDSIHDDVEVWIEKNTARPGNHIGHTYTAGVNNGRPIGVARAFGIEPHLVPPANWKKELDVERPKGMSREEGKQISIDKVHELFPEVSLLPNERCEKEHDGMAEGLLIAEYGRRQYDTQ